MKCCLCGNKIDKILSWTQGHNAVPLKDGRCCSACNYTKVIPKGIRMIKEAE